jgi:pyrroline-5-carboxylate reductase
MKITIAGCGNMGLIYARAFLKYNIVSRQDLLLAEKNIARKQELEQMDLGSVTVVSDPAIAQSDIIILAVKPQDFSALAGEMKQVIRETNLVISIMAGVRTGTIVQALGTHKVVRAMPNSPAGLGLGMTALAAGPALSEACRAKAVQLISTTGRAAWLPSEDLMDAVTALSGSGPAYFFYLVKHMIEAGTKMGLDAGTSAMLVRQTMLGAYHLMEGNPDLDGLVKAVASKGGTTEAALQVFGETGLGLNLERGILRARDRAGELSEK